MGGGGGGLRIVFNYNKILRSTCLNVLMNEQNQCLCKRRRFSICKSHNNQKLKKSGNPAGCTFRSGDPAGSAIGGRITGFIGPGRISGRTQVFFVRQALPPFPNLQLYYYLLFGGFRPLYPPFFHPTRWLPRTPCSYDQREGSGEPPNGFADAKRGQCFGHRVQQNCGQQFFDATRRTHNCPTTPILPTDTVANSQTLQKYKVIFTMIFCVFHKSCIQFLTAIFSETHWCNPFFPT